MKVAVWLVVWLVIQLSLYDSTFEAVSSKWKYPAAEWKIITHLFVYKPK
jgi:hypothetical protein